MAEGKAVKRVYLVTETTEKDDVERLVRAGSQHQAVAHVVKGRFDATIAKVDDVARLVASGVLVVDAGTE